jgi:hypothetical protein
LVSLHTPLQFRLGFPLAETARRVRKSKIGPPGNERLGDWSRNSNFSGLPFAGGRFGGTRDTVLDLHLYFGTFETSLFAAGGASALKGDEQLADEKS